MLPAPLVKIGNVVVETGAWEGVEVATAGGGLGGVEGFELGAGALETAAGGGGGGLDCGAFDGCGRTIVLSGGQGVFDG